MGHVINEHPHDEDTGHGHGHHDDTGHGHDHESQPLWGRVQHAVSELVGGHSHDTADQIDDALEADSAGRRALFISLIGLGITAAVQGVVVVVSGSIALLGDTLHNVADALTAVPLLIAFTLARRLPTKRYTYGYDRAEDIGGLFVIAMMALSSVLAGYEAINRLLHPESVSHLWAVAAAGWSGSSATRSSPVTASASAARSAQRPWSPTGCTPGLTASPVSPSYSVPAVWRWAGRGPTRSSASPSPSPSSACFAQRSAKSGHA
jgi:hypothetical protein